MGWDEYKRLCDRPDVWSRWMLAQTRELLVHAERDDLAQLLDIGKRTPVPKPSGHKGDDTTDMFQIALTRADVAAITGIVTASAAAGERTQATRARGLGGFVEAWSEYLRWCERR
jgi:hypothetical protein